MAASRVVLSAPGGSSLQDISPLPRGPTSQQELTPYNILQQMLLTSALSQDLACHQSFELGDIQSYFHSPHWCMHKAGLLQMRDSRPDHTTDAAPNARDSAQVRI